MLVTARSQALGSPDDHAAEVRSAPVARPEPLAKAGADAAARHDQERPVPAVAKRLHPGYEADASRRRTISAIQAGAYGDVQPGDAG